MKMKNYPTTKKAQEVREPLTVIKSTSIEKELGDSYFKDFMCVRSNGDLEYLDYSELAIYAENLQDKFCNDIEEYICRGHEEFRVAIEQKKKLIDEVNNGGIKIIAAILDVWTLDEGIEIGLNFTNSLYGIYPGICKEYDCYWGSTLMRYDFNDPIVVRSISEIKNYLKKFQQIYAHVFLEVEISDGSSFALFAEDYRIYLF